MPRREYLGEHRWVQESRLLGSKKLVPVVKRVSSSTKREVKTAKKALREDGPFSGLV